MRSLSAMVTFFEIPDPLVPWHILLVVLSYGIASFIIGLFNIAGGVLYVPTLLMLPGVTPIQAVGTVFVSSIPLSLARLVQRQMHNEVRWRLAIPMAAACVVAGILGQILLPYLSANLTKAMVGCLAVFAGADELRKTYCRKRPPPNAQPKTCETDKDPKASATQSQEAGVAAKEGASSEDAGSTTENHAQENAGDADEIKVAIDGENAKEGGPDAARDVDDSKAAPPPALKAQTAAEEPPLTLNFMVRAAAVGFVGGLLSSVAGLGGPIAIMPLYMQFMPKTDIKIIGGILSPVACSIVTSSLIGAFIWGNPDVGLGLALSPVGVVCVLIGGHIQNRVSSAWLKPMISGILVVFGGVIVVRVCVAL